MIIMYLIIKIKRKYYKFLPMNSILKLSNKNNKLMHRSHKRINKKMIYNQ